MNIIWRESASPETYEAARLSRVFNGRCPQRFPLAVVQATSESDVLTATKLVELHNCRIAVRSGGHSFPVWSVQDDSILIDLGDFKVLDVNEEKRTAKVSPSVTSKELNDALIEKHGLMFPGGHCPDVGLGGFLLQGGMGWNCRNWGWACERVEAVEMVTVEGKSLFCNAEHNPELYWAARGAGPGFPGIVTKFHLNVIPYPKHGFRSSGYVYPKTLYKEAFAWVLRILPEVDQDTEVTVVSHHHQELDDTCLSIYFNCMKTSFEEAQAALRPIQEGRPSGVLTEWECQEDSLAELYKKQGTANQKGRRYHTDSAYVHNDANVVDVLEEAFLTPPSKNTFAFFSAMYPWSRRELPDMALSMRSDNYFAVYTSWEDERDDDRCQSWLQQVMKKVKNHAVGSYLGDSDLQKPNAPFWDNDHARRLLRVCQEWDPKGRMCRYQIDSADLETRN